MLGKTHLVVGTAVTMTIMQPQSFSELLIGLGTSVIGAVISDIDVGTSKSSKAANRIIAISLVTVAIVFVLECFGHIGVLKLLQKNSSLMRAVIGALCFIGVCIFGKMQPHRSFMHSFLALGILSGLVAVILPIAVPYFAIAFLTHLAIDVFNFKKVKLLYPVHKGVCFRMFHATGTANTVFFMISSVITAINIVRCVWNIIL